MQNKLIAGYIIDGFQIWLVCAESPEQLFNEFPQLKIDCPDIDVSVVQQRGYTASFSRFVLLSDRHRPDGIIVAHFAGGKMLWHKLFPVDRGLEESAKEYITGEGWREIRRNSVSIRWHNPLTGEMVISAFYTREVD